MVHAKRIPEGTLVAVKELEPVLGRLCLRLAPVGLAGRIDVRAQTAMPTGNRQRGPRLHLDGDQAEQGDES